MGHSPQQGRCSPCSCCVKVGTRAGHSSCLSAAGEGKGRHQDVLHPCMGSVLMAERASRALQANVRVNPAMGFLALVLPALGGCWGVPGGAGRVPWAIPARDEARRHCPIPATSYCFVDMENPVSSTIYLFNKVPAQLDLHK